jgi:pimeloyl-ACP methyl ester carboxylesterase
MIVQAMALRHPGRVLSMTSVMSAPGPIAGERDPEAAAAFSAPGGTTREEAAERRLAGLKIWGSPACFDVERITADAQAAYDRCWDPEGYARQAKAIGASPSREAALGALRVPSLIVHGDADRLVPLVNGRATAAAIPGARLEIVEGMGHDYPPQYWDRLVTLITTHAQTAAAGLSLLAAPGSALASPVATGAAASAGAWHPDGHLRARAVSWAMMTCAHPGLTCSCRHRRRCARPGCL